MGHEPAPSFVDRGEGAAPFRVYPLDGLFLDEIVRGGRRAETGMRYSWARGVVPAQVTVTAARRRGIGVLADRVSAPIGTRAGIQRAWRERDQPGRVETAIVT